MADQPVDASSVWWGKNLDDVDREIVRLCSICRVRILEPGVIERVLANDASACGSANALAFEKLRTAMMVHYQIQDRAANDIGEAKTAALIRQIVERLAQCYGNLLGKV